MITPPSKYVVAKYESKAWDEASHMRGHFTYNGTHYYIYSDAESTDVHKLVLCTNSDEDLAANIWNWYAPRIDEVPADLMAAIDLWLSKDTAGLTAYEFLSAMLNEP